MEGETCVGLEKINMCIRRSCIICRGSDMGTGYTELNKTTITLSPSGETFFQQSDIEAFSLLGLQCYQEHYVNMVEVVLSDL